VNLEEKVFNDVNAFAYSYCSCKIFYSQSSYVRPDLNIFMEYII
jgi:hypothetical protein